MTSHNTLSNYYRNVFTMTFHHKYSIKDVEDMIVYELELYSSLIKKYIEDKEREENKNGW